MKKKILCVIIAVAMVLALFPAAALAEGGSVTFYVDNEFFTQMDADAEGYAMQIVAPEKDGAIFCGWYEKNDDSFADDPFDFDKPITGDLKLYARYGHTVSFEVDNGTAPDQIIVMEGESVTELPSPSERFKTFSGWFRHRDPDYSEPCDSISSLDSNTTLYGYFTDDPAVLCVGDVMVDPASAASGTNWSYDPDKQTLYLSGANITSSTARIHAKNMDLIINLSNENTVSGGEYGIYVDNGNLTINGDGTLTGTLTLQGSMRDIASGNLTISGCTVKSTKGRIETTGSIEITKSDVTALGPSNGSGIDTLSDCTIEDSIVKATGGTYGISTWGDISIKNSTVESNGDAYAMISSISKNINFEDAAITSPEGAVVIDGMIKDGTTWAKNVIIKPVPKYSITADSSLKPEQDYVEGYKITPEGSAAEGKEVKVEIALSSNYAAAGGKPTKLYFKTDGGTEKDIDFSVDGVTVTGSFEMPNDNVTVYAEWVVPDCTVSFETNDGTAVPPQTVKFGEKATKPEDPSKDGCTFYNWFGDEACTAPFDFTQAIDGDTTVYAYWLKNISGFRIHTDGTEKGSDGYYNVKADVTEVLFEKDTADVSVDVKPLSKDPADYTDPNKLKEAPEAGKEYYFHVELTDVNGKPGRPTVIDNGKLKTGTEATAENATITLMDVAHSVDERVFTMVFKYVENEPEPEPEPDPEPKPEPEPEPEPEPAPVVKPVYWISEGTDLTVSKDTAEGLKLTVHRKPGDDLTYSLFTGVEMGGNQLSASDFTAESGSLKLTVKPSYIKGLAVGSHTLKVKFSDGDVTANVKVTEASDNPRTGDESGLMLWILIAVIAAGGIIAALLVYRKQSKRE